MNSACKRCLKILIIIKTIIIIKKLFNINGLKFDKVELRRQGGRS